MEVNNIIRHIAEKISSVCKNQNQANIHAWWILQWLTDMSQASLISQKKIQLTQRQKLVLSNAIDELVNKKKPIQYIFGRVQFLDLTLQVEPPILIPRPETEYWVGNLIDQLKLLGNQTFKVLDLCTGSGCIGLAFAKAFKKSEIIAVDISQKACSLAHINAKLNEIDNIKIIKSDLFQNVTGRFDLIVTNPPYVSYDQWLKLEPVVKDWEDKNALVAKDSGLAIIKKIISQSVDKIRYNHDFLTNKIPQLAIEIGYNQGKSVQELLERNKFVNIEIKKDLYLKDRVAIAGVLSEECIKKEGCWNIN